MIIYTSARDNEKQSKMKELGLGMMLSPPSMQPRREFSKFDNIAIDNGAYSAWLRGFPFMKEPFIDIIYKAYKQILTIDFIVAPDIIGAGIDSYNYSVEWMKILRGGKFALAVQDGLSISDIKHLELFSHIFIGGTKEWKWETAKDWVKFAHDNDKKCHIARCGTLKNLIIANDLGADSVDSTNFCRNQTWDVITEFREQAHLKLL